MGGREMGRELCSLPDRYSIVHVKTGGKHQML